METPELKELFSYLDEITTKTRGGTIEWVQANPTTYMWNVARPPHPARVTIQRIDAREQFRNPNGTITLRIVPRYVFQTIDLSSGGVKLSLNGTENSEVNEKLKGLYEAIQSTIARSGIDFLKSIIPPT